MVLYHFEYRFKRGIWCRVEALSAPALELYIRSEFKGSGDFEVREIRHRQHSDLYQDESPHSPTLRFISIDAILLGESHTSAKLTGKRNFYTSKEVEASAKVEFAAYKAGILNSSEKYYSQPWI